MLEHFREVERTAASMARFSEAARLLAGADLEAGDASATSAPSWSSGGDRLARR